MRRLLVIAVSFVLTLAAVVAVARARWLEAGMKEGRTLYARRQAIRDLLHQHSPAGGRSVLYMGDSTIMGQPHNPAWQQLLAPALRRRGVRTDQLAFPGEDLVHHYCTVDAFLDERPEEVVVVVVHMRLMFPGREDGRMIDLCSFLPPSALPRSLVLPWYDRNVSLVRLALTKTLAVPWVEDSFIFAEGLRRLFVDAWMPAPPAKRSLKKFFTSVQRMIASYDRPLTPRQPMVRMLGAVVAEICRRGAQPLAVVTPIPPEATRFAGGRAGTDPWISRMRILRGTVEAAGGRFLDLHGLLDASGFRDYGGHLSPRGHALVANAVAPTLFEMLGLPPPRPLPVPPAPAQRRPPSRAAPH
jgi:lysophospholipase L1-like esterase